MADEQQYSQRYIMALYYAYGRADAPLAYEGPQRVDPIKFAEFYMAQWDEFQRGESSYMRSVQDAWDVYRRSLA